MNTHTLHIHEYAHTLTYDIYIYKYMRTCKISTSMNAHIFHTYIHIHTQEIDALQMQHMKIAATYNICMHT